MASVKGKVNHSIKFDTYMSLLWKRTFCAEFPFKTLNASICTGAVGIVACFIIQTVSTCVGAIFSIRTIHASLKQKNCLSNDKDRKMSKTDMKKKINRKGLTKH